MSELTFCKTFLTALDARPVKLSSDHIADARQYPDGAVFVLPKLPPPPHPARPSPKTLPPQDASSSTLTVSLKPMKPSHPTVTKDAVAPAATSIYDLKSAYAAQTSIPPAKIKILYKKKPVTDSKTVAEVVGVDAGAEVEFGVMVLGGAVAGGTPVQSPPAVAPGEEEKGLAGAVNQGTSKTETPGAQGPSGQAVVNAEFWDDLKGFVVQRIRDEKEGDRMVGVFKSAWEKA
ncbi:uncharacterized protein CC84DRAFT_1212654 [Paraphaeosphaeria sporulosa]|uniref:Ubiquitin-like domain-containing protein n=1 Tax=Paraphaeosphaeria sporulosa TaxID=1460663 RepID=A0A177CNT0_9PLEO|nr:uncharacterized protein CC84DRAFT_1212654 [Paraphaeosphaeria sporulosa]OAG09195.1 hypothetical protein CC84DRAFT_1212654 [Paraphaeosphaeria sporulosa]